MSIAFRAPPAVRWTSLAALALASAAGYTQPPALVDDLRTLAESTGYAQTGRYDEVERLCHAYAARWPKAVRCEPFGTTPEGRPMLSLVASRSGTLDAAQARRRGLPVMVFQGGIHAGEIDGKDAGFLLLRELLEAGGAGDPLRGTVLVFVPVFNVDGHERFGRWNRPNQVGPESMGWRTTARNLNLNRDYMKADAPEMQAMLRLLQRWDPILYVDLHVTDGAQFENEVSVQVEPLFTGDAGLRAAGQAFSRSLLERLAGSGTKAVDFYPSLVREDDPSSGFEQVPASPRFSQAYWSQHNRFGVLVETHSWKPYARRVTITHDVLRDMADALARDGATWLALARQADEATAALAGSAFVLDYKAGEHVTMIDFPGVAWTREPSAVSGALWTRYDASRPQAWHVPLRDEPVASIVAQAPRAGYVVPAAWAGVVGPVLALHGIRYESLAASRPALPVKAFRSTAVEYAKESFEGRVRVALAGQWQPEARDVPAGSLYVPVAQPAARVLVALLEPTAPDSLASWGTFSATLERKEYMEDYVVEQVAREQLAADPALAQAFAQRLASDPAFAASPAARLAFFSGRHPSADERWRLYPVLAVDELPLAR